MLKSFKNGILTLAVLATTVIGFAQPAAAQFFGNPYNGYNPQVNYVSPYNNFNRFDNSYNYGRRRSILKPALIGAGIGGAVGLGASLLHNPVDHGSRHYVRNIGIGAGVGAGVGVLGGLLF